MPLPSPTAIWTESPRSGAALSLAALVPVLDAGLSTTARPVYELLAQRVGGAALMRDAGLSTPTRPVYELDPTAVTSDARLVRRGAASSRPILLLY
jgi:hypothetical protein